MSSRALAKRYARALLTEAGDKGADFVSPLSALDEEIRAHRNLERILFGSVFSVKQRTGILEDVAAKLGTPKPLVNFARILIENDRMKFLPSITEEFQKFVDEKSGIARARVASATELPADAKEKIRTQLERIAGRKVDCIYTLDPALIGGVQARIGDLVLDGSVSSQLRKLSRRVEQSA